MIKKHKALGRGLDSLLGPDLSGTDLDRHGEPGGRGTDQAGHHELRVDQLQAGQYQPRTRMDDAALQELAASIREHGILQPIVVRPLGAKASAGITHEIIAGERRYRAARLANLVTVPVIVKEVSDENALALALIENIQREDLNPLEEASAIRRLIDEFDFTHEQAAQSIGRSRSATSNLLRLLNLAEHVQQKLLAGDIEMGHARCLLPLERVDQVQLADEIIQRRLSVREAEKLAQLRLSEAEAEAGATGQAAPDRQRASGRPDPDVMRLQERIADRLGTRVELDSRPNGKGRLVIHFSGNDVFSDLLTRLNLASAVSDDAG